MKRISFLLRLSLLWSEVTLYYLFYYFLVRLFEGSPLLPPLFFYAAAFSLLVVAQAPLLCFRIDGAMVYRTRRWVAVSLLLGFVLLQWIGVFLSGGALLSAPAGLTAALSTVLTQVFCILLLLRVGWLSMNKKEPNVFGHFDFFLFLTFLALLCTTLLPDPLPGGAIWVASALFFNSLSLYFRNRPEGAVGTWIPWLLAGSSGLLFFGFQQSAILFPSLTNTADKVLALVWKPLAFIVERVGNAISAMRGATPELAAEPGSSGAGGGPASTATADFTWMDHVMEAFLWVLAIGFFLAAVTGLLFLLRFLLFRLVAQFTGHTPSIGTLSMPDWRDVLRRIHHTLNRGLAALHNAIDAVLLLLPIGYSPDPAAAYRRLEKWGTRKARPRDSSETPSAYLKRLVDRFPSAKEDLVTITQAFLKHRYADPSHSHCEVHQVDVENDCLRQSLRRLYFGRLGN
ncbi:MAG: hypothetical protein CVU86_07330 [Firmicutes bacterium HGW-Firmicutes-11]|jgi:hypothetical protein|nr:MAG: hypothetical protein CVU86_07330 [Firmicutes bacterium HGW-Firmicutes-11]